MTIKKAAALISGVLSLTTSTASGDPLSPEWQVLALKIECPNGATAGLCGFGTLEIFPDGAYRLHKPGSTGRLMRWQLRPILTSADAVVSQAMGEGPSHCWPDDVSREEHLTIRIASGIQQRVYERTRMKGLCVWGNPELAGHLRSAVLNAANSLGGIQPH